MKPYSEKQIRLLHQKFKTIKRYADKLAFYDRHFGIIAFPFPAFDPALSFFFEESKTRDLIDLLKKERHNPSLNEKLFSFGTDYRFSIKPANSNNPVYSTYILSKFLSLAPDFDRSLHSLDEQSGYNTSFAYQLRSEINDILNSIEFKLRHEYDKSLKLHCMTVFYKGYYDAFTGKIILPDKKRKFIELYLYAQGVLYSKYVEAIRRYRTDRQYNSIRNQSVSQPDVNLFTGKPAPLK